MHVSQPALGWLKVCYDVDKHLSLPSLYGYRLATVYFRYGERGGESFRSFRCKFVGRSVLLCFGFLYEKSSLSWLAGQWGDCSLDPPWSYADARVFKGAKIGFGLGTLKFSLHLVFWHTGSPV